MGMLPRGPTFQELAADALDGDGDAALQLAKRQPDKGFEPWFKRWVPAGERNVRTLDVFADAYRQMELDRLDKQCADIKEKP